MATRPTADGPDEENAPAIRVCFVCLGNICRSPTAAGVMNGLVADAGLSERIEIDSAGTGAWHVGEPPDARAAAEARSRGLELHDAARQFVAEDLDSFDLVLAMDADNIAALMALVRGRSDSHSLDRMAMQIHAAFFAIKVEI